MSKWIISFFVVSVIALCVALLPKPITGELQIGEQLPDLKLYALKGKDASIADFKGKPLIINVWASWCGPCRSEMASLQWLADHPPITELHVIGISTDDYLVQALAFLNQSGMSFPNFIDTGLVFEKVLGANRIPLTVLVSSDGVILEKTHGARDWASQESMSMILDTFRKSPER